MDLDKELRTKMNDSNSVNFRNHVRTEIVDLMSGQLDERGIGRQTCEVTDLSYGTEKRQDLSRLVLIEIEVIGITALSNKVLRMIPQRLT